MTSDYEGPRLYTMYHEYRGDIVVDGYAYGDPWVEQALLMGDIKFKSPEEARAWWEANYE